MQYRTLGRLDLEVSEISLGSWLTDPGGAEAETTAACTDAAADAPINFFDTASRPEQVHANVAAWWPTGYNQ